MPSSPSTPGPLSVFTFAVWTSCAVVGGLGLALHYPKVSPRPKEAEPAAVVREAKIEPAPPETPKPEILTPKLAPETRVADDSAPKTAVADSLPPPPAPPPLAPPDAPAFTAVAAPDAPVAFALPVEGPTRVVPHELAAPHRETGSPKGVPGGTGTAPEGVPGGTGKGPGTPGGTGEAPKPQAQNLVFGQGEGAQAKPDYPREAQRRRQEGTVRIRLEVDESGAVTAAEIEDACPFPLLNQAALGTVKRSWKFPAGPKRLYTVAIKFVLQ